MCRKVRYHITKVYTLSRCPDIHTVPVYTLPKWHTAQCTHCPSVHTAPMHTLSQYKHSIYPHHTHRPSVHTTRAYTVDRPNIIPPAQVYFLHQYTQWKGIYHIPHQYTHYPSIKIDRQNIISTALVYKVYTPYTLTQIPLCSSVNSPIDTLSKCTYCPSVYTL